MYSPNPKSLTLILILTLILKGGTYGTLAVSSVKVVLKDKYLKFFYKVLKVKVEFETSATFS